MSATITFYGGAGTVTGANFLFDSGVKKILVDCGAIERESICDPANHEKFPYDTSIIDTLIVTHAHMDHIGRIPKLVHEGFKGDIISTPATRDLTELMFQDALHVMQTEAQKTGCEILYNQNDVECALALWKTHEYHEKFSIGDVSIELLDAGHILGSAMVRMSRGEKTILFTGDLGNSPEPLLNDTESPAGADYLLMESVYGDKVHEEREDRVEILRRAIEGARTRGGTLLIPSFSIERTQIILYEIHELIEQKKLAPIPVYLDAPLAQKITEVFRKYTKLFNPEAQKEFVSKDAFLFPKLVEIMDTFHSEQIHQKSDPKIIIAGAGMSSGGRIRAHEVKYLPDPKAAVLFTGYQAPGSLGRRIQDGASSVVIDRTTVAVRAHIDTLSGFSGHKDRDGLLQFAHDAGESLKKVFVVMGEPKSSMFLAQRIKDFLDVEAIVPQARESATIDF